MLAYDLQSNGKARVGKSTGYSRGGVPRYRNVIRGFHPGNVVFHLHTGNFRRIVRVYIERQDLIDRQHEEIEFILEPASTVE